MNELVQKSQGNKNQPGAPKISQIQRDEDSSSQFVDNRPETDIQKKLQDKANNSFQVSQLRAFEQMVNTSQQSEPSANFQADTTINSIQPDQLVQEKDNKKELPENLKTGIKNLSGYPLDDVKVHRNSEKPAQLQALVHAQGTDIH